MFHRHAVYFIVTGALLSLAAAGSARGDAKMGINGAKKYTAYPIIEKDKVYAARYRIFPLDSVAAVAKLYGDKETEDNITKFFTARFDKAKDGAEEVFRKFTAQFDAKDLTYYNFFAYVFMPERLDAFADDVETEYFAAAKKAGITSFGIDKMTDVDTFFVNYFKTNKIYDVDTAYAAFEKTFGAKDVTFGAFRTYFFAPAFMRYIADDTVTNIGAFTVEPKPANVE